MKKVLLALVFVLVAAPVFAAFVVGRATVGTSATLIYTSPPSRSQAQVRICNRGAASVFIGPAGVTTTSGFEIVAAGCETVTPFKNDTVWGVVASGTNVIHWAEVAYIK